MHENLKRREKIKSSSDRTFGFVIAAGFALMGLMPMWRVPHEPRWWALSIAVAFALCALVAPTKLSGLNRLWQRLGLLLSAVVSPVVLGLLFYTTILPLGLLMRLSGKDPLRLRPDHASSSYWISRAESSSLPDPMRHQF